MNITAKELSGMHLGKTVTVEDRYTGESVTSPLVAIWHNRVTAKLSFRNRNDAVYANPDTPITIQEGQ